MTEFFEEVGEGRLYLSGDGQGTECLHGCPVAQRNRPGRSFGHDTANLYLLSGTEFFQWAGRKADGCFHDHGKILKLTKAGVAELKNRMANAESDYEKRKYEVILKQVKRHRVR